MRILDTVGRSFVPGVISVVPTGRLVWVDQVNGHDALAVRERLTVPFKTLAAAKVAAADGDTIMVLPGTYNEKDLLKDGVNWYFMPGAKVHYSGAAAGGIFDTNGIVGSVTCLVAGYGEFKLQSATGSGHVVRLNTTDSNLVIQARSMSAADSCIKVNLPGNQGSLVVKVLKGIEAGASHAVDLNSNQAVTRIEAEYIITAVGSALYVVSANALVVATRVTAVGSAAIRINSGGSGLLTVQALDIISQNYVAIDFSSESAILHILNARILSGGEDAMGRAIDIRAEIGTLSPARVKLTGCVLLTDLGDASIEAAEAQTKIQLNGGGAANMNWSSNIVFVGGGTLGTASTAVS